MFNNWDEPLTPDKFISIVVMSYTRPKHLKNLLESIHKHADMPFEVIVHDDASGRDHEVEIFNECRHLCSTLIFGSPDRYNMGLAASCNRAIALANSKYIMMINDDCEVLRPPFEKLVKVLDIPYIGCFGPWQTVRKCSPGSVSQSNQAPITANGVDFHLTTLPTGAGMMAFRKEVWEECGGFPGVYTNAGDTCFMINAMMHGYFNASMYINEEEFFTNVDQLAGYEDPTAGKTPYDNCYPHVFGIANMAEANEGRRVRIYNYSHHNYYAPEGIVAHSWWHENYFSKAYDPATHSFDWGVLKHGQEKWREPVEEDMGAWRAKAQGVRPMNKQQFDALFDPMDSKIVQRSAELWIMVQAIQAISVKRVLEIGTANGGTLKFWEQVAGSEGKIVSVDSGAKTLATLPVDFSNTACDIQLVAGFSQAPETIEKVKQALGDQLVDFLYIDGSHEYEDVKADFDNYHSLVRPGGIIGFHDVNHPPVQKLWNEINIPHKSKVHHDLGLGTGIIKL